MPLVDWWMARPWQKPDAYEDIARCATTLNWTETKLMHVKRLFRQSIIHALSSVVTAIIVHQMYKSSFQPGTSHGSHAVYS